MISEMSDLVDCCLVGRKGSLAASLDYALSKGPAWLGEMFGNGVRGQQAVRRILKVSNPNRKRPGPVAISVNKNTVSWDQVRIYWDERLITDVAQLHAMLIGIEEQGGDESGRDGGREAVLSQTAVV
jgi:hypothetical protein